MKTFKKTAFYAATALGLIAFGGGSASAQTAPPMDAPGAQPMQPSSPTPPADMPANPAPNMAQPGQPMPDPTAAAPQPGMSSAAGMATPSTAATVTNGPIPDTLANRAKYGAPKSHAGKKTPPKGN